MPYCLYLMEMREECLAAVQSAGLSTWDTTGWGGSGGGGSSGGGGGSGGSGSGCSPESQQKGRGGGGGHPEHGIERLWRCSEQFRAHQANSQSWTCLMRCIEFLCGAEGGGGGGSRRSGGAGGGDVGGGCDGDDGDGSECKSTRSSTFKEWIPDPAEIELLSFNGMLYSVGPFCLVTIAGQCFEKMGDDVRAAECAHRAIENQLKPVALIEARCILGRVAKRRWAKEGREQRLETSGVDGSEEKAETVETVGGTEKVEKTKIETETSVEGGEEGHGEAVWVSHFKGAAELAIKYDFPFFAVRAARDCGGDAGEAITARALEALAAVGHRGGEDAKGEAVKESRGVVVAGHAAGVGKGARVGVGGGGGSAIVAPKTRSDFDILWEDAALHPSLLNGGRGIRTDDADEDEDDERTNIMPRKLTAEALERVNKGERAGGDGVNGPTTSTGDRTSDTDMDYASFSPQLGGGRKRYRVGSGLMEKLWGIEASELELGPMIGEGSYGQVYEGLYNGTHVAVKKILFQDAMPANVKKSFRAECQVNLLLRHPNVVLFMGLSTVNDNEYTMVIELCEEGSLYDIIKRRPRPPPLEHRALALKLAIDTTKGMCYLHGRNPPVLHLDLKSPNVLVTEGCVAKISDFGLSHVRSKKGRRSKSGAEEEGVGSLLWAAPEILNGERGSEEADVYAFAVVLWELLHWNEPFPELAALKAAMRVVAGGRPEIDLALLGGEQGRGGGNGGNGGNGEVGEEGTGEGLQLPGMVTLLQRAWSQEPELRPTFIDILDVLQAVEDRG